MPVNYNSNRQLHARNTKAVPVAQKRIDQVADLAQEQYNNALSVNGYDALVYNRLTTGRRCTCSHVFKHSEGQILDDKGNASEQHIQTLLTGAEFAIEDYATGLNRESVRLETKVITPKGSVEKKAPFKQSHQIDDPFATQVDPVEISMEDAFSEVNLGAVTAGKCALCYGSGFIGGYALHNGNRFVLDATWEGRDLYGYSVRADQYPNLLQQENSQGEVRFTITLPMGIVSVDRIQVWNNAVPVKDAEVRIGTSLTNLISLDEQTLLSYATGTPCFIVVSGAELFSHLELQFNMSTVHTYIEYPRLTKTGDLTVLESIDSVQLIVSPLVLNVQAWDIVVDNVFKKIWRVTSSNWFNDRKMNIHGWDVQARLVQEYEVYKNVAGRFANGTRYVSTRLPRF